MHNHDEHEAEERDLVFNSIKTPRARRARAQNENRLKPFPSTTKFTRRMARMLEMATTNCGTRELVGQAGNRNLNKVGASELMRRPQHPHKKVGMAMVSSRPFTPICLTAKEKYM